MFAGNAMDFAVSSRRAPSGDMPRPMAERLVVAGRALPATTNRLDDGNPAGLVPGRKRAVPKPDRSCASKSGQFYFRPCENLLSVQRRPQC